MQEADHEFGGSEPEQCLVGVDQSGLCVDYGFEVVSEVLWDDDFIGVRVSHGVEGLEGVLVGGFEGVAKLGVNVETF